VTSWPFDDLLGDVERIRGDGWVDIEERLALERLLSRYDGAEASVLRDAIAALLARNADEAERIGRAFDTRYHLRRDAPVDLAPSVELGTGAPPSRLPESSGTASARWIPWTVAFVAALVVVVGWASVHPGGEQNDSGDAGPTPTASVDVPPNTEPKLVTEAPPAPSYWPPSTTVTWVAVGMGLVALFCFGLLSGRRKFREWRARRWNAFLALPGPRDYGVTASPAPSPKVDAIETMTAALEAIAGKLLKSSHLDIDETVRRTVQRAAVTLVHTPANWAGRVLVLRDVGQPMLPWRAKFDRFIAELQRTTVVEMLYFDDDPSLVSPVPSRYGRPLHEWSAHCSGLPLVLLTDGRFLVRPNVTPASVREVLEPWPLRVILHPLEHQALWPSPLRARDSVLSAFPMSPAGLRALLRWLPSRARDARARFQPQPAPLWPGDVLRLRAMLSFFPRPTLELAELLRGALMPEVPDSVLLTLDPVLFPTQGSEEIQEARAWLREWFAQRRLEAKKYEDFWNNHVVEPPAGSAAHQRYARDLATLKLYLGLGERDEVELLRLTKTFAASPLADEWHRELKSAHRANPPRSELRRRAREVAKTSELAAYETPVGGPPRRFTAPSKLMALGAVGLGLVALSSGVVLAPLPAVPPVPTDTTDPPDQCPTGWDRCGGEACLDLANDAQNCGTCGAACPAGKACRAGGCGCVAPLTDCSGTCVDLQTAPEHCGTCASPCEAGHACSGGECERCAAARGETDCGGSCVRLQSNVANCGACGKACASRPNARRACNSGACSVVCLPGYANCDGKIGNGCEVNLNTDINNCGRCERACRYPSSGTIGCLQGQCTVTESCSDACASAAYACLVQCEANDGKKGRLHQRTESWFAKGGEEKESRLVAVGPEAAPAGAPATPAAPAAPPKAAASPPTTAPPVSSVFQAPPTASLRDQCRTQCSTERDRCQARCVAAPGPVPAK
jgi:hypothetical protein